MHFIVYLYLQCHGDTIFKSGEVWISLNGFTLPYFCSCPKSKPTKPVFSLAFCWGLFFGRWFELRGNYCWYLCNSSPSLFWLSFHNCRHFCWKLHCGKWISQSKFTQSLSVQSKQIPQSTHPDIDVLQEHSLRLYPRMPLYWHFLPSSQHLLHIVHTDWIVFLEDDFQSCTHPIDMFTKIKRK